MSNEQKNSRTVIEDLPVAEQELTAEEMEKVEGGKTWNETRSNNNVAAALSDPIKTQTPLPPAPAARQTPKRDFGD